MFPLSVRLPSGFGLESLVLRKRADRGSCDDLHSEVFCVMRAELPWQKKGFKSFWHILTFNIKVELMLGCLTSELVRKIITELHIHFGYTSDITLHL